MMVSEERDTHCVSAEEMQKKLCSGCYRLEKCLANNEDCAWLRRTMDLFYERK